MNITTIRRVMQISRIAPLAVRLLQVPFRSSSHLNPLVKSTPLQQFPRSRGV
jgi:hypothetical protein